MTQNMLTVFTDNIDEYIREQAELMLRPFLSSGVTIRVTTNNGDRAIFLEKTADENGCLVTGSLSFTIECNVIKYLQYHRSITGNHNEITSYTSQIRNASMEAFAPHLNDFLNELTSLDKLDNLDNTIAQIKAACAGESSDDEDEK